MLSDEEMRLIKVEAGQGKTLTDLNKLIELAYAKGKAEGASALSERLTSEEVINTIGRMIYGFNMRYYTEPTVWERLETKQRNRQKYKAINLIKAALKAAQVKE
jgi:hypothetical protein